MVPTRILLSALLLATAFAGCAEPGASESAQQGGPTPTPTLTGSNARFEVIDLVILGPDGEIGLLHEDDENATIRYIVRQPTDAPGRETAFVTYVLNGRIVDIAQLHLDPGDSKQYERTISDLRAIKTIGVEVRAAGSIAKASADILTWPRAAEGTLTLGPVTIRADYGLMETDGRVLVNLTIDHIGPEQKFGDFRVKMLCITPEGEIDATKSVDVAAPTLGNMSGVNVIVDNCAYAFYGLEFKARGEEGDLVGRMLLVPAGWRPPTP